MGKEVLLLAFCFVLFCFFNVFIFAVMLEPLVIVNSTAQVKVMQCWRCKAYGHRTGDRECPLGKAGNIVLDAERQVLVFRWFDCACRDMRDMINFDLYQLFAVVIELR